MNFQEHLKEALSFEEEVVHKINHILTLFLDIVDLPQDAVREVKEILRTLSDESLYHKSIVEGILKELEGDDK